MNVNSYTGQQFGASQYTARSNAVRSASDRRKNTKQKASTGSMLSNLFFALLFLSVFYVGSWFTLKETMLASGLQTSLFYPLNSLVAEHRYPFTSEGSEGEFTAKFVSFQNDWKNLVGYYQYSVKATAQASNADFSLSHKIPMQQLEKISGFNTRIWSIAWERELRVDNQGSVHWQPIAVNISLKG